MDNEQVKVNISDNSITREQIPAETLATIRAKRPIWLALDALDRAKLEKRESDLNSLKTAGLPELREILARLIDA